VDDTLANERLIFAHHDPEGGLLHH
jgi:hypothetical protein